jgi:hypothetical protein
MVTCTGRCCHIAACALVGENGREVDPQDDVGCEQSMYMIGPSHHALHEYALYWAIEMSHWVLYLLLLQLRYVAKPNA